MKYSDLAYEIRKEKLIEGRFSKLQKKIILLCPNRRKFIVQYLEQIEGHNKKNIYRSIKLLMRYGLVYLNLERSKGHKHQILCLSKIGWNFKIDTEKNFKLIIHKEKSQKINLEIIKKDKETRDKIKTIKRKNKYGRA